MRPRIPTQWPWLALALVPLVVACGDDDGATNDNNNNNQTNPLCGDGHLDGGEECDDGAANSDSEPGACRSDCTLPTCGDGVIDPGLQEACDDGAANSDSEPDACRSDCTLPTCGDGVIDPGSGEACDDGAANGDGPDAACRTSCQPQRCGDGIVDAGTGEACDDGNTADNDGCTAGCVVEPNFACDGAPSACACVDYHRGADCSTCSVLVKPGGGGAMDGKTWASAHSFVDQALSVAEFYGPGCDVWVAEGTYYLYRGIVGASVNLRAGVGLYGGFAGTESALADRDVVAHPTILHGGEAAGTNHVTHAVRGANSARIDGFTITGGSSGVYNQGTSPTIANCTFLGAAAHDSVGVFNDTGAQPLITACTFSGHQRGQGLAGAAMHNNGANPTVESCLFYDNVAFEGGAMGNLSSSPLIVNCTFADNQATSQGGALFNSNASPQIFNTIIWGNSPDGIYAVGGGLMTRYYNVLQDGDYLVNGNIADDPLFVSSGTGDYRLSASSPCIDTADAFGAPHAPPQDLVGQSRVDGNGSGTIEPDRGALEYVP